MQLLYHRLHVRKTQISSISSLETQDFITFLCLFFLMLWTSNKNGLQPCDTVAERQHNQSKWIISTHIISLWSYRIHCDYILENWYISVPLFKPTTCNFTAQLHFTLSSLLTPYLTMKKCTASYTVLLGLLDQSPIVQHSDFEESRSRRESSVVLP